MLILFRRPVSSWAKSMPRGSESIRLHVRTPTPALHTRSRTYSQNNVKHITAKEEQALGSALRESQGSIRRYIEDIDNSVDWKSLLEQITHLKTGLEDEDVWVNNAEKALKEQTRMARLQKQLTIYQALQNESTELSELLELALATNDIPMQQDLLSELDDVKSRAERYLISLRLSGPVDDNSAYLEVHAGSGGTEACDWALMLSRMYSRWANDQHHKVQVVDETPGEVAGVKSITLLISGPYAYGYLQFESGVHRLVRISPFDQAGARHTSFASVRVSPHFDENEQDIGIEINPADLKITTMRSQGAGGQHVNKTESAVRIVHVPSGITVACQQERSQHKNKALALARLRSKLYEVEVQKRAQAKSDAHETLPENGWGSQIRSYVLQPYQLVKDVRTGCETNAAQKVLDGDITTFLEASLREFRGKQGDTLL